jgi:uncharacterized protein (TIGR01777 family)
MKHVLVSGATGFIGRRVVQALGARGDRVTVLTRDPDRARRGFGIGISFERWDPRSDAPIDTVAECDAVVHLAGERVVGVRWTEALKREILESRVKSTERLVRAMERAPHKPRVFVSASGIGYFGDRSDETVAEDAAPGSDFLAGVTIEWERAAARAEALGVRVVRTRFGIVLGRGGGALVEMVKPFKLFVGGPIGTGRQMVAWIHLDDAVGAILLALDDDRVRGPVNVVAPNLVTNAELARAIGNALHRPSRIAVPKAALILRFGEGAEPLVTGQRAVPQALERAGYRFKYPTVETALAEALK